MESSCCLFHELRLLHCLSKSNRQRQSPRRYENHYRKETCIIHLTASRKDTIYAYKVSTGIDIITPGTSTVDHIRDFDTDCFGRFQCVSNTASINAFHYVWIVFPPKARFRIDMSWLTSLHSARRRLPTRLS